MFISSRHRHRCRWNRWRLPRQKCQLLPPSSSSHRTPNRGRSISSPVGSAKRNDPTILTSPTNRVSEDLRITQPSDPGLKVPCPQPWKRRELEWHRAPFLSRCAVSRWRGRSLARSLVALFQKNCSSDSLNEPKKDI